MSPRVSGRCRLSFGLVDDTKSLPNLSGDAQIVVTQDPLHIGIAIAQSE